MLKIALAAVVAASISFSSASAQQQTVDPMPEIAKRWAEAATSCLKAKNAYAQTDNDAGCYITSDAKLYCTSRSFKEPADKCVADASKGSRPARMQ